MDTPTRHRAHARALELLTCGRVLPVSWAGWPLAAAGGPQPKATETGYYEANDEYNPWNNPDPSRAFILATGFANQRGNAVMLLHANSRRRFQRASRGHASGQSYRA